MKALHWLSVLVLPLAFCAAAGCQVVPRNQLTGCETRCRVLAEQNRAQLAELENLKAHARDVEDRLMRTEKDLSLLEGEVGLDWQQLAEFRKQRAELYEQFKGLANGGARIPPDVSRQLVALSQRYCNLHFDPATGISKLDTDILFDSGAAELKDGAEQMLRELVHVLNGPEARQLKILVVGHTDNQRVAKKPARQKSPNNFYLSTARAHAVADLICREGFPEERLGVAGFGSHQPVAPNVTPQDRRKNRRVEIFVMAVDVPVVGWTESTPSLY